MVNKWWTGGSGNWSDTSHWASSLGGIGGDGVPVAGDVVSLTGLSGSVTVNVDMNIADLSSFTLAGSNCVFNSNNYSISAVSFSCYTGTINLGTSSVTATSNLRFSSVNGSAANATLNLGGDADSSGLNTLISLDGIGLNVNRIVLKGSSTVSYYAYNNQQVAIFSITGTNKIVNIINAVSGAVVCNVGTFSATGTIGKYITLNSSPFAHTFSKTTGVVNCDYLNLTNIHATGGAVWNAGIHSINGGNNTGWSFSPTPAATTNAVFFGSTF